MNIFRTSLLVVCYASLVTDGCTTPNGEQGHCVSLNSCSKLRQLFQALKSVSSEQRARGIQFIRRSICGTTFSGQPRFCCGNRVVAEDDHRGFRDPPTSSSSNQGFRRAQNRNFECGTAPLHDRIILGRNADVGEYPWAGLIIGSVAGSSSDTHFCGATLISENFAITAAHCLVNTTPKRVRFGEHTVSQARDCDKNGCSPPVQDIPIRRFHTHPEYNRPCSQCNDVALLELSRPVLLDPDYVTPICLPQNSQSIIRNPNAIAVAIGWGSTLKGSQSNSADVLQEVELPLRELNFCRRVKRNYLNPKMVICAGGKGKDTCRGDSGGPLMITNRFGNRFQIIGITSIGPTFCGVPGTQALYTNVEHYLSWIRQVTGL